MEELKFKNPLNKIAAYVLVAITGLLVLFLLLAFLRIGIVYWLWSTVETWVTVRLGLDYYASQLLTMIVVSTVVAVLPTLAWYLLLGRRKWEGTAVMIGGQALVFILVYTIGSGVCFDRRTGEPLCWYADIPGKGRVFSKTPGFDPETGEPFKQYTRETARSASSNANSAAMVANMAPDVPQTGTKRRTLTIPSTVMWYDTGIDVPGGATVNINYESGQWTNLVGTNLVDGQGKQFDRRDLLLVPSSYLCALVGKVANNHFHVGNSYAGSPGKGRLFLSMNDTVDNPRYYADNGGALTVLVEIR